jgi:hypothetical protein
MKLSIGELASEAERAVKLMIVTAIGFEALLRSMGLNSAAFYIHKAQRTRRLADVRPV